MSRYRRLPSSSNVPNRSRSTSRTHGIKRNGWPAKSAVSVSRVSKKMHTSQARQRILPSSSGLPYLTGFWQNEQLGWPVEYGIIDYVIQIHSFAHGNAGARRWRQPEFPAFDNHARGQIPQTHHGIAAVTRTHQRHHFACGKFFTFGFRLPAKRFGH